MPDVGTSGLLADRGDSMASQYLFGGVKSGKVLCLYPIGEPHGVISDCSVQIQVTGTVMKIIYTQQVMPAAACSH